MTDKNTSECQKRLWLDKRGCSFKDDEEGLRTRSIGILKLDRNEFVLCIHASGSLNIFAMGQASHHEPVLNGSRIRRDHGKKSYIIISRRKEPVLKIKDESIS